ncbi:MAG: arsenosugar biosynthesis radical SAM protein ArsS [Bdellovibrionales bacterium]|nr:arsenosugar biosynthesis radical SAM protein ArsS [Bdellovibrionales bacterium]
MKLTSGDQIQSLENLTASVIPSFRSRLEGKALGALSLSTMQINLGKMCNQTCKHCHVDAGPTRKEIMSQETMLQCLKAMDRHKFEVIDLTGGAPEMNPHFRWFVEQVCLRNVKVLSRCNLTIIEAHKKYEDLPDFYARNRVEIVSSLPFYTQDLTDRQRGNGVFSDSIAALKKLNRAGYGIDQDLVLNLVYNPNGAFLPADQDALEADFKRRLYEDFGIQFNRLFTITNMPISRFLEFLIRSNNLQSYMKKLSDQFNKDAVETLMCRSMLSVSWEGWLYDCDFNQMLDIETSPRTHISEFNSANLVDRKVNIGNHCYGCTAGRGSSCGGTIL